MEKDFDVKIEEYLVDQVKCIKDGIIVYFRKKDNEYKLLKIGFYNGTDEINFILYKLDNVANSDILKTKKLEIATIDSIPIALIDSKNEDICIIKYPVSEDLKSFNYKGNIHGLQLRYKTSIESIENKIKEKLDFIKKERELKLQLEMI